MRRRLTGRPLLLTCRPARFRSRPRNLFATPDRALRGNRVESLDPESRRAVPEYRAAVADLTAEIAGDGGGLPRAEAVLRRRLGQPEILDVLARTPGGAAAAGEALLADLRRFVPNPRSSATDLAAMVRVFLLSQIDAMWWARTEPFGTDDDLRGCADLVELDELRRAGRLDFDYRRQPGTLGGQGGGRGGAAAGPGPDSADRRPAADAGPAGDGGAAQPVRGRVRQERAHRHPPAVGEQPHPQRGPADPPAVTRLRRGAAQRPLHRLRGRRRDGVVPAPRRARRPAAGAARPARGRGHQLDRRGPGLARLRQPARGGRAAAGRSTTAWTAEACAASR